MKLADFGLARPFDADQQRPYTNRVITLWYRPPELLLGATMYGPAIDMWSAGCIFAELLLRKPILPGKNEFEQIDLIFKLLGTPDEAAWPKCSKLQYYDMILSQNGHRKYQSRFDEKFGQLDPLAKDLLRKLLMMDPDKRITADDALDHEYFWSDPAPATPDQLPKYPPSHEFTAKKRRQQSQAAQQQQQPLQTQLHHSSQMQPGAQHLPFQQQQHPSSYPPPAYNGNNPHHASNPFYAAARSGSGAGGGGNPSQGGPPHAKRFREGQPPGGHSSGFFDQAQHQQQPNGGPRHHPTGGYPGGGWPGNR